MARDRLFRLAETRPEMFDMNCDPPAFVAFQVEQRPEKPAIKSKK
jgi:hypothetical protein